MGARSLHTKIDTQKIKDMKGMKDSIENKTKKKRNEEKCFLCHMMRHFRADAASDAALFFDPLLLTVKSD
jgi:hypothetical protein